MRKSKKNSPETLMLTLSVPACSPAQRLDNPDPLCHVPCDARCQKWKCRQNPFDYVDEIMTIGMQMFGWQADHPLPKLKREEEADEGEEER